MQVIYNHGSNKGRESNEAFIFTYSSVMLLCSKLVKICIILFAGKMNSKLQNIYINTYEKILFLEDVIWSGVYFSFSLL